MGQFPYQLSWRNSGPTKHHFCGAEILDEVVNLLLERYDISLQNIFVGNGVDFI